MNKAGLIVAAMLMASSAHASFSYSLTEGPADKQFRQNAQILLKQAEQLLPVSIKSKFKKPLEVRFESLKENGDHALGKLSWGKVRIDLKAIPEIRRGESNATRTNRTHKTFYREILATVMHETIHAYDKMNDHDADEARMIRVCKEEKEDRQNTRTSPECKPYENMYRSYSQNPYFTMIAGFVDSDESWMKHRSPDIYELTSAFESFAVNMEYFLMDPDYACRRPSLYHLFRTKFKHTPFPNSGCQVPLNYVIPDFKGKDSPLRSIDPSRIYQVHYLLAAEGEAMMSGWGHSMFRLVMCAPERKVVGPDCLKDLDQHIVLSYRAFVNSIQINTLKGLTGDYPSRLFLVPMHQVIDEYTKTELRDLRSVPMNLSRDEIRQFVTRTIETHWSYDGRYYFTSNNCAVESLNLMKGSLFRPELIYLETKTPIGLEKDLLRLKIADNRVFANRTQAINTGYLFDSYRDRYEMSFKVLKDTIGVNQKDFRELLSLTASQRGSLYSRINKLEGKTRRKAAAAIVLLENGAHRFLTAAIKADLTQHVIKEEKQAAKRGETTRQKEIVTALTEISDMFSQPASFLKGAEGYGLPTEQDWEQVQRLSSHKQNQGSDIYDEVQKNVESLINSAQMKEVEAIKKNVEFALSFMRSI
ncbi:hypothetical protein Bb109J_c3542 [Bdellovibrio bacteriovorus]|uniref:DUF7844 domain-containing protein n=1 Tax=Bdellovibrio bacteriovorus TaxID=959 RepID=UPI00045BEA13|nr:DUF4105 domain-containing protein [Bdellovibrio bacteriovorus]AHZ85576.1 hypothetical protein EP01_11615 [Bdellovibrio bacteriovorus]BEV70122.1 hypothetical protein Bb109J_c3542 [Bdellovibrio bacteriovorus]